MEHFYGIIPVEEDGEIFYPAMMLIIDSISEAIIGHYITHPHMVNIEFQQLLLRSIEESGIIPRKVQIAREETFLYLIDIFQNLGVEVEIVKKLNIIPNIKRDMFNSMM